MLVQRIVSQPASGATYTELFQAAAPLAKWSKLDVAVAYASRSGVAALLREFEASNMDAMRQARSRWIVGIDWFRSDPEALEALDAHPGSELRIAFGKDVIARKGCVPKRPFHPKAYLLAGPKASAVILGSGNLSNNGLLRGHEWGVLLAALGAATKDERRLRAEIRAVRGWYEVLWQQAMPYAKIKRKYSSLFRSTPRVKAPTPVDDDASPAIPVTGRRGAVDAAMLMKLRVAKHLWIEAGLISKNRGKARPGNQLMMSAMTKVFFGFVPKKLKRDTRIGPVTVKYNGKLHTESLRFSNNSMEVLTLPIPGTEGPPKYDKKVLRFTRRAGSYELEVLPAKRAREEQAKSDACQGAVKMSSGRVWGVY